MNTLKYIAMIIIIAYFTVSPTQAAKPAACTGVSKTCTENERFDKTIDGQDYSCYSCKQVVCKSGGNGPIAGTETSSVCESKTPNGRALIKSNQALQFDEADAIFGTRTGVDDRKPPTTIKSKTKTDQRAKTVDHRTDNNSNISSNNKERGTQRSNNKNIEAPTQVNLYDVTNTSLSISWMDNASNEYGVSVERGTPTKARGGVNYHWQHVFNVEERVESNTKGTGWRSDGDDGLSENTEYCYRIRAYKASEFSKYSPATCIDTKN